MHRFILALAIAASASAGWVGGCAPRQAPPEKGAPLPEDAWSRGVWLYGQHCAGCHGDDGRGGEDTPPIAGEGSLPRDPRPGSSRTRPLETAADVFAVVCQQMPPMEPGSLEDEECWPIMVYLLKQAGIRAPAELGPGNAAGVRLR